MRMLLLTLDAPLMSFGAPIVDNRGQIQEWPAASMLVGLLANALGYERRDFEAHRALQRRLRYAARRDQAGERLSDYQTVDLGQPHLLASKVGWTTWGKIEKRGGSNANRTGTHIRYRDYHVGAIYTIALTLEPADEAPTLDDLAEALRRPARPLFIGRMPCLPSGPILRKEGIYEAESLFAALKTVRAAKRPGKAIKAGQVTLWWSQEANEDLPEKHRWILVTDERDWKNQVFRGERLIYETTVPMLEASDE